MDISIIIPTYNRNSILYKGLAAAYGDLKGMNYEVIVVNDSKQNKVEIPTEWRSNIYSVDNPKKGVASARNLGASLAKSDKIVFVDDDMILNKKAIVRAIAYLNDNKDVCLNVDWVYPDELNQKLDTFSFGRYLVHFGFVTLRGWQGPDFDWRENAVIKADGVTSQFLAMSKATFLKSGGYDENFPFAGFEDHAYHVQLVKNGIEPFIDTSVRILHNEEDRIAIDQWLLRKFRGGHTRRVAVDMGYKELEVDYNNLKGTLYFVISKVEFLFTAALKAIPNNKLFDPLYFRIVNILLGTNLYKGYMKHDLQR